MEEGVLSIFEAWGSIFTIAMIKRFQTCPCEVLTDIWFAKAPILGSVPKDLNGTDREVAFSLLFNPCSEKGKTVKLKGRPFPHDGACVDWLAISQHLELIWDECVYSWICGWRW